MFIVTTLFKTAPIADNTALFFQDSALAMAVTIKTPDEIEKMRVAGRLAAEVLKMIAPHVQPGITTGELDRLCHHYIVNVQQAIPAPLNYKGFPKSICTSVNHQVCHGIPGNKTLKKGDIVNVDITVIKDEYHGDTSKMFFVGEPSIQARRLVNVTHECMLKGIELVRPGIKLGDIG
ncbi:MAG TPA: type I methionyl aminopeptidase, partial [Aestuariivirgaceae bacterium]|nr:type I methionyl aminopeptidase [Aestuariivirgaceae bacterium]